MAHILIGWEFGGNRGHAIRMARIAERLRAHGHRVSFALQRVDALSPEDLKGAVPWPAPISPRLLVNTAKPKAQPPATLGDIMVRLGLEQPDMVASVLRSWRQLLEAIQPDLVVAEFAPFLLTAARGLVPSLAGGTGFDTPPSAMPRFPSLIGQPATYDEDQALEWANAAVFQAGCRRLERLPQLFEADVELPGTFAETDPYREWRIGSLIRPALTLPYPGIAPPGGEEVFVYAPELLGIDAPLWKGLALSRLPIRVHIPRVSEEYQRELKQMGFLVEPEPLPFPLIAQRSRLLVSHGGHGFVCSAFLSGLPQVVCHYDIEKLLHGRAVAKLGVGGLVAMAQIEPQAFAASLVQLYRDEALAGRARAVAPDFQSRYPLTMEDSMAEAADSLL